MSALQMINDDKFVVISLHESYEEKQTEKSYYLEDGIWNDIKEYAGIYNIKIDWDIQNKYSPFKTTIIDGIINIEDVKGEKWQNTVKKAFGLFKALDSKKNRIIKQRINIAKGRFFKHFWKRETFQYISDNLISPKRKQKQNIPSDNNITDNWQELIGSFNITNNNGSFNFSNMVLM